MMAIAHIRSNISKLQKDMTQKMSTSITIMLLKSTKTQINKTSMNAMKTKRDTANRMTRKSMMMANIKITMRMRIKKVRSILLKVIGFITLSVKLGLLFG